MLIFIYDKLLNDIKRMCIYIYIQVNCNKKYIIYKYKIFQISTNKF